MSKLLELVGKNADLKKEYDDALAAKRNEGVVAGKREGFKEAKALATGKTEKADKKEEVAPSECFKKYKDTFEKQPKVCRACPFSQKCKPKK